MNGWVKLNYRERTHLQSLSHAKVGHPRGDYWVVDEPRQHKMARMEGRIKPARAPTFVMLFGSGS